MSDCMKNFLTRIYYKFTFRKSHIYLEKSARVLGRDTHFEGYNKIGGNSSFHGSIGYGSYIGRNSHLNATIGKYCCISDRVYSISGTHPTDTFVSVHPAFYSTNKQCGFSYVDENSFSDNRKNPVDGRTAVYI